MSHQFGAGEEFYHGYSVDDEDQPQGFGESLTDDRGLDEPLDEGYSPPDRWSTGQGFGNTAFEAEVGETLAQRLAQEEPEPDPYAWRLDDGQPEGRRVGGFRAGHLLAYDPGSGENIIERVPHSDASDAANFSFMAGQEPYWGRQVGDRRAGRLVSFDTDSGELTRDYLFAQPPPVPCGLLRTMQNERLTPSIPPKAAEQLSEQRLDGSASRPPSHPGPPDRWPVALVAQRRACRFANQTLSDASPDWRVTQPLRRPREHHRQPNQPRHAGGPLR